jgi:hypothetical protein
MNSARLRIAAAALVLAIAVVLLWLQFTVVLSLESHWQRRLVLGLFLVLSSGLIFPVLGLIFPVLGLARHARHLGGPLEVLRRLGGIFPVLRKGWKAMQAQLHRLESRRIRKLRDAAASESQRIARMMAEKGPVLGRAVSSQFENTMLVIADRVRANKKKLFFGIYISLALLTLAFQLDVRSRMCTAEGTCAASYAKAGAWAVIWPLSWIVYLKGAF